MAFQGFFSLKIFVQFDYKLICRDLQKSLKCLII